MWFVEKKNVISIYSWNKEMHTHTPYSNGK